MSKKRADVCLYLILGSADNRRKFAAAKDTLVIGSMLSGAFSFAFLLMACVGTMNAFAAVSVGVICAALSCIFYLKVKNCPHFHIEFIVGSAEATISLKAERQKVVLDEKTLTKNNQYFS